MPRIYIDVSETYQNKLETGIQRVVRSATKEMMSLAALRNLDVWLYVSHPSVDKSFVTKDLAILTPPSLGQDTQSLKEKIIQQVTKVYSKMSRGKLALVLASRPVISCARWMVNRIRAEKIANTMDLETPGIPDYFLILDSFWSRGPIIVEELMRFKFDGARVGLLVYDITPLTHPQFTDEVTVVEFQRHLENLIEFVDDFFFISNFVKEDLVRQYGRRVEHASKTLIPLGVETLPQSYGAAIKPNKESRKTKLLSIGTVEPRKNYSLLMEWWIRHGIDKYELTIVGKPGWKTDGLQAMMIDETSKDNGFRWLGKLSEEELRKEMESSDIGIVPSFVEGYGLPIIEMAGAGLKVVASDIPVFREVAPKNTFFFDPMSSDSLQEAIDSCASSSARGDVDFSRPWSETANALFGKIQETDS